MAEAGGSCQIDHGVVKQRPPAIPPVEHAGDFVASRFRLPEHLVPSCALDDRPWARRLEQGYGRPTARPSGRPRRPCRRRVRGGEHLVSYGDAGHVCGLEVQSLGGYEPMSYCSAWDRIVAMAGSRSS